ncbi:MAG TPA: hypothetical protein VMW38_13985 [Terriglobia bacterium]|nr:hypothetical protein [Terriglobia bacterium]
MARVDHDRRTVLSTQGAGIRPDGLTEWMRKLAVAEICAMGLTRGRGRDVYSACPEIEIGIHLHVPEKR